MEKRILCKALKLQKCFDEYKQNKKEVRKKFISVWGETLAEHFLCNNSNAEEMIWSFDSDNLQLFINKF